MNQLETINRNFWGDFFGGFVPPDHIMRPFFESMSDQSFKVDIKDRNDHYEIQAELPGLEKKDIKIEVKEDKVIISADTQKVIDEKADEKVVCSERYFGWLTRTVQLNHAVESEGAVAKYDNGVLTLKLLKTKNRNGRLIAVK